MNKIILDIDNEAAELVTVTLWKSAKGLGSDVWGEGPPCKPAFSSWERGHPYR